MDPRIFRMTSSHPVDNAEDKITKAHEARTSTSNQTIEQLMSIRGTLGRPLTLSTQRRSCRWAPEVNRFRTLSSFPKIIRDYGLLKDYPVGKWEFACQ
jgi:hypothetical protein